MNLSCNLYVDGEFEGTIHSSKEVNIGKNGHIKGDIFSTRLVVQGYIEGTVNAQKVEIKAMGRVNGSIEFSELIIEAKGIFEGKSTVKNVSELPKKPSSVTNTLEIIEDESKQEEKVS